MKWKYLLILILLLPLTSSVDISNTTFITNTTNFSVFVDSITLDLANITNESIFLHNVSSLGSNLTNTNPLVTATVDFIGLNLGFGIRNLNTSTTLFKSRIGSQDFGAIFIPDHTIQIIQGIVCTARDKAVLNLMLLFFALAIIILTFLFFFHKGDLKFNVNTKMIVIIFIGIIMGIVFFQVLGESVFNFCG